MPQLDILTFPAQIFWLAISFIILYAFISFVVIPGFNDIFKKRYTKTSVLVEKAENNRNEAIILEREYNQTLNEIKRKHFLEVSKKSHELLEEIRNKFIETDLESQKMLRNAEHDLAKYRIKAHDQLNDVIINTVKFVVKSITNLDVKDSDIQSFIKEKK